MYMLNCMADMDERRFIALKVYLIIFVTLSKTIQRTNFVLEVNMESRILKGNATSLR